MKRKLYFILLITFLLVLTACGSDDEKSDDDSATDDKTLLISIPDSAGTLDPGVSMDNAAWKITYPAYERLLDYDGESSEVKPGLAKEWEISDDGKTYTFILDEGHKFADGSEVDADAVKYSFERILEIAKGPSDLYNIIEEITVEEPNKITFELENNFPPFLSTLAANYGGIVNPKVEDHAEDGDMGQNYLANKTMGSGPYQLDEFKKGEHYKLTSNTNSAVQPKINTVYFQVSSDISSARLRLEKGEVDIVEGVPIDQMKVLEEESEETGINILEKPSLGVDYVYMNSGKGKEAMKNIEFRQGLSYAIDAESMVNDMFEGYATKFQGPVPEGLWGHDPDAKMYEYDPEKAEELIKKSGFEGETLDLLYSDHLNYWEQMALSLQDHLKDVGVEVNLTNVAYETMREQIDAGEFDLSLGIWSPDYGDPYMFMNYWFDSENSGLAGNRSFYENAEVDDLVREAAKITEQDEREDLYRQAQEIVNEEAAYIYIAQQEYILPMRDNITGFVYNPMLENIYNLAEMDKE